MGKIKFYILFWGAILVFLSINAVLAQGTAGDVNKVGGQNLPNLKAQSPGELLKNLYNFSLIISGLLAFGAIVYGGVLRASAGDNSKKIEESKEWIKSAIIGLILLFGAYILLNTINPALLRLDLPSLKQVEVSISTSGSEGRALAGLSDSDARKLLKANGIDTKLTNTSLEGIKEGTVNEIIRMKQECDTWMQKYYSQEGGCNVFISGGTENGPHTSGACSHGNGYKVDLRLSTRLNEFIEKTYKFYDIRTRDGALMYKSPTGAIYAKEDDHWDVQVNQLCK